MRGPSSLASLGVSKWTVRNWIRDGELRPVRLGRRVLLSEEELERFVTESQRATTEAETNKTVEEARQ